MSADADIQQLVEPVVAAAGLELYDCRRNGGALQVLVTSSGGVDLDALSRLSGQISRALDDSDPISGSYTLEVSSPGLERPLRDVAHFAGAVGETVTVRTRPEVEGDRRATGMLRDVEGDVAVIEVEDGEERRVAIGDIERARTIFEWGPAPKPGQSKKNNKKVQS